MRLATEVHTMSNHTPGPWFSPDGKAIKQDYRPIGLTEAAGCMIGAVMGGPTSGPAFIEIAEEVEANTRLISAAPDLLDALEGLLFAYNDPGNTGSTHSDKVEAAQAAIAKARVKL
jgi:hypothetical protein